MIQRMLAIWSLVPLPFLNPAWTSGSSQFTYCWSLAWRILSITLLACIILLMYCWICWYFVEEFHICVIQNSQPTITFLEFGVYFSSKENLNFIEFFLLAILKTLVMCDSICVPIFLFFEKKMWRGWIQASTIIHQNSKFTFTTDKCWVKGNRG